MTESYLAVCPRCATTNRIPATKPASGAKCGKCGAAVFDGHPVALSTSTFERHVANTTIPVVIDFWADWCGPCKMMAPAFAQAARDMEPRARFAKLDTEAEPSVAARFNVRSIPTMILFKGGREVARQSGALPAPQIEAWVRQHA